MENMNMITITSGNGNKYEFLTNEHGFLLPHVYRVKFSDIDETFIRETKKLQLSEHFSLWEMCQNFRKGYIEQWNFGAGFFYLPSLSLLATSLLEPLRKGIGKPIHVNSAMRWSRQTATGWEGLDYEIRSNHLRKNYSQTSQHCKGEGIDLSCAGVDVRDLWTWVKDHSPNPWGQIIYELGDRSAWLHMSIPGIRNKASSIEGIYGEVLDAQVDSLGRAKYTLVDKIQGRKDRWGRQAEFFSEGVKRLRWDGQ